MGVLRRWFGGSEILKAQEELALGHTRFGPRHARVGAIIAGLLETHAPDARTILEIGASRNSYRSLFREGAAYACLDLTRTDDDVIVGDITDCPQIASDRFDVILSVDVFEHIDRPWLAAREITRMLKPGGFTFHSTLFSWRYHPAPGDYFRYSPDGIRAVFSDIDCILSEFDATERRRDIVGKGTSRIEPDAFGGWRENWRVNFAGLKPE